MSRVELFNLSGYLIIIGAQRLLFCESRTRAPPYGTHRDKSWSYQLIPTVNKYVCPGPEEEEGESCD